MNRLQSIVTTTHGWWVWGPIEIKNEAGDRVRIICADADGNVIDFAEE